MTEPRLPPAAGKHDPWSVRRCHAPGCAIPAFIGFQRPDGSVVWCCNARKAGPEEEQRQRRLEPARPA